MKQKLLVGISLSLIVGAAGCSTAKVRVMPGEGGMNHIVVRDRERDDAETAAVDAANDYCKDLKKRAIFVKNETKYTGTMDETTRNTVRKASRAAEMIGMNTTQPGAGVPGGVVGEAGRTGEVMTDDRDYQTTVDFKCE